MVTLTELGASLKIPVFQLTNASHTSQVVVAFQVAPLDAQTAPHSEDTSAREALLSKPVELRPPSNSLNHQAQLRLDSLFLLTSSITRAVSIITSQVANKEVMLLKSLDGANKEMTIIGFVLILGETDGERVVSSESDRVTQASTKPLSVAHQTSTQSTTISSNERKEALMLLSEDKILLKLRLLYQVLIEVKAKHNSNI